MEFDSPWAHCPSSRREKAEFGYYELKDFLVCFASKCSKWQLEEIRKIVSEAHNLRFKRRREPKYGNMNKGFTEEELERFFQTIDDPRIRLLFRYQATLALRIGEAVKIHLKDINLVTRELRIDSEKVLKTHYLLVPHELFEHTIDYVNAFQRDIEASGGWLFPKNKEGNKGIGHLDMDYARKVFAVYRNKAGLDEVYGSASDINNPIRKLCGNSRKLYRLTTHSLRHYAITHFSKASNGDVVQTCKFARHTSPQMTMRYIHSSNKELYESIDKAFSSSKKYAEASEFWKRIR